MSALLNFKASKRSATLKFKSFTIFILLVGFSPLSYSTPPAANIFTCRSTLDMDVMAFMEALQQTLREISNQRNGDNLSNASLVRVAQNVNLVSARQNRVRNGAPHGEHSVRLALTIKKFFRTSWPQLEIDLAMAQSLVHEALAKNATAASYEVLREKICGQNLHHCSYVASAAIILAGPELPDPSKLGIAADSPEWKTLQKISVSKQIRIWAELKPSHLKAMLAAAIADQLVELFDVSPITENTQLLPEDKKKQVTETFALIQQALEEYEEPVRSASHPALSSFLLFARKGLNLQMTHYGISSKDMETEVARLSALWDKHAERLMPAIRDHLRNFEPFPEFGIRGL
jgi:hypothetical protein